MSVSANDWVSLRQPGSRAADLVVVDPRQEMARRLPAGVQGLLTWLTAMPADGEAAGETTALRHLAAAFAWTLAGLALGGAAFAGRLPGLLLPLALLLVCCGLGLFQVVIFHHCAHGTVFRTRRCNTLVRLVSISARERFTWQYIRNRRANPFAASLPSPRTCNGLPIGCSAAGQPLRPWNPPGYIGSFV